MAKLRIIKVWLWCDCGLLNVIRLLDADTRIICPDCGREWAVNPHISTHDVTPAGKKIVK